MARIIESNTLRPSADDIKAGLESTGRAAAATQSERPSAAQLLDKANDASQAHADIAAGIAKGDAGLSNVTGRSASDMLQDMKESFRAEQFQQVTEDSADDEIQRQVLLTSARIVDDKVVAHTSRDVDANFENQLANAEAQAAMAESAQQADAERLAQQRSHEMMRQGSADSQRASDNNLRDGSVRDQLAREGLEESNTREGLTRRGQEEANTQQARAREGSTQNLREQSAVEKAVTEHLAEEAQTQEAETEQAAGETALPQGTVVPKEDKAAREDIEEPALEEPEDSALPQDEEAPQTAFSRNAAPARADKAEAPEVDEFEAEPTLEEHEAEPAQEAPEQAATQGSPKTFTARTEDDAVKPQEEAGPQASAEETEESAPQPKREEGAPQPKKQEDPAQARRQEQAPQARRQEEIPQPKRPEEAAQPQRQAPPARNERQEAPRETARESSAEQPRETAGADRQAGPQGARGGSSTGQAREQTGARSNGQDAAERPQRDPGAGPAARQESPQGTRGEAAARPEGAAGRAEARAPQPDRATSETAQARLAGEQSAVRNTPREASGPQQTSARGAVAEGAAQPREGSAATRAGGESRGATGAEGLSGQGRLQEDSGLARQQTWSGAHDQAAPSEAGAGKPDAPRGTPVESDRSRQGEVETPQRPARGAEGEAATARSAAQSREGAGVQARVASEAQTARQPVPTRESAPQPAAPKSSEASEGGTRSASSGGAQKSAGTESRGAVGGEAASGQGRVLDDRGGLARQQTWSGAHDQADPSELSAIAASGEPGQATETAAAAQEAVESEPAPSREAGPRPREAEVTSKPGQTAAQLADDAGHDTRAAVEAAHAAAPQPTSVGEGPQAQRAASTETTQRGRNAMEETSGVSDTPLRSSEQAAAAGSSGRVLSEGEEALAPNVSARNGNEAQAQDEPSSGDEAVADSELAELRTREAALASRAAGAGDNSARGTSARLEPTASPEQAAANAREAAAALREAVTGPEEVAPAAAQAQQAAVQSDPAAGAREAVTASARSAELARASRAAEATHAAATPPASAGPSPAVSQPSQAGAQPTSEPLASARVAPLSTEEGSGVTAPRPAQVEPRAALDTPAAEGRRADNLAAAAGGDEAIAGGDGAAASAQPTGADPTNTAGATGAASAQALVEASVAADAASAAALDDSVRADQRRSDATVEANRTETLAASEAHEAAARSLTGAAVAPQALRAAAAASVQSAEAPAVGAVAGSPAAAASQSGALAAAAPLGTTVSQSASDETSHPLGASVSQSATSGSAETAGAKVSQPAAAETAAATQATARGAGTQAASVQGTGDEGVRVFGLGPQDQHDPSAFAGVTEPAARGREGSLSRALTVDGETFQMQHAEPLSIRRADLLEPTARAAAAAAAAQAAPQMAANAAPEGLASGAVGAGGSGGVAGGFGEAAAGSRASSAPVMVQPTVESMRNDKFAAVAGVTRDEGSAGHPAGPQAGDEALDVETLLKLAGLDETEEVPVEQEEQFLQGQSARDLILKGDKVVEDEYFMQEDGLDLEHTDPDLTLEELFAEAGLPSPSGRSAAARASKPESSQEEPPAEVIEEGQSLFELEDANTGAMAQSFAGRAAAAGAAPFAERLQRNSYAPKAPETPQATLSQASADKIMSALVNQPLLALVWADMMRMQTSRDEELADPHAVDEHGQPLVNTPDKARRKRQSTIKGKDIDAFWKDLWELLQDPDHTDPWFRAAMLATALQAPQQALGMFKNQGKEQEVRIFTRGGADGPEASHATWHKLTQDGSLPKALMSNLRERRESAIAGAGSMQSNMQTWLDAAERVFVKLLRESGAHKPGSPRADAATCTVRAMEAVTGRAAFTLDLSQPMKQQTLARLLARTNEPHREPIIATTYPDAQEGFMPEHPYAILGTHEDGDQLSIALCNASGIDGFGMECTVFVVDYAMFLRNMQGLGTLVQVGGAAQATGDEDAAPVLPSPGAVPDLNR